VTGGVRALRAAGLIALAALIATAAAANRVQQGAEASETTGDTVGSPPQADDAPATAVGRQASTDANGAAESSRTREVGMENFQFPPEESPDQNRAGGGFLGNNRLIDALILIIAGLFGALVAGPLALRSARHAALKDMAEKIDRIEAAVNKLPRGNPGGAPAEPDRAGGLARSWIPQATDRSPRTGAPQGTGDARDAGETEHRHRSDRAVQDYARLVAAKNVRPQQLSELLNAFQDVRGLQLDSAANVAAVPYLLSDLKQLAVAMGDGRSFEVVPTHHYAATFAVTFASAAHNPPIIRKLFEFRANGTRQLQVDRPARVSIDEAGTVHINSRGILSGFEN
jgi:hypothetical protein